MHIKNIKKPAICSTLKIIKFSILKNNKILDFVVFFQYSKRACIFTGG